MTTTKEASSYSPLHTAVGEEKKRKKKECSVMTRQSGRRHHTPAAAAADFFFFFYLSASHPTITTFSKDLPLYSPLLLAFFFVLLFRFEFINALKFEYEMVFSSSSSSSSFVLLKTKNSRRRRRRRREEEFQRLFRNSYRRSGRLRIRHHRRLLSFFLSLFLTFLHL